MCTIIPQAAEAEWLVDQAVLLLVISGVQGSLNSEISHQAQSGREDLAPHPVVSQQLYSHLPLTTKNGYMSTCLYNIISSVIIHAYTINIFLIEMQKNEFGKFSIFSKHYSFH